MTAPTPPSGRKGDPHRDSGAEFDAVVELAHASVDAELTPDEHASISPDETWRMHVERARTDRDIVHQAMAVGPVDDGRRDAHISAALSAFDEVYDAGSVGVAPAPPQPPGARSIDQLAHRRRLDAWLWRAPVGIAAAVLAAVAVIGVTQLTDDEPSDTVAVSDDASDDASLDASDGEDGAVEDSAEATSAPAPEEADDSPTFGEANAGRVLMTYALTEESDSLDLFVDSVAGVAAGDQDVQTQVTERSHLDLGPRCTEDDVVELAATPADAPELTLVQGVLDGRAVVGVINRSDPGEVTVIDLDRCAVEAVLSP